METHSTGRLGQDGMRNAGRAESVEFEECPPKLIFGSVWRIHRRDMRARREYAGLAKANIYPDVPYDPMRGFEKPDVEIFAHIEHARHLAFCCLSPWASPDPQWEGSEIGPGNNWLEDVIVRWHRRGEGIDRALESACLYYLRNVPGRILTTSLHPLRDIHLKSEGWQWRRDAYDEFARTKVKVFEYPRSLL